jgi:hypothetical protein
VGLAGARLAVHDKRRSSRLAVQVAGGYGHTREFLVERYMREAKAMQIFEDYGQNHRVATNPDLAHGSAPVVQVTDDATAAL